MSFKTSGGLLELTHFYKKDRENSEKMMLKKQGYKIDPRELLAKPIDS
jgi:hypothetical protein